MSRKLYLDDAQVAAGQDALKPLREDASPELVRFIDAVMALRRNTPKDWRYRTVTESGEVLFAWSKYADFSAFEQRLEAAYKAKTGHDLPTTRFAFSIRERKRRADLVAFAFDSGCVVERRASDNEPWTHFYTGRPEKAKV